VDDSGVKLEKEIIKIVSVHVCRMRRFAPNIAQKRLASGLRLDPLWELTALPQGSGPLAGLRGNGGEDREGRGKKGRG